MVTPKRYGMEFLFDIVTIAVFMTFPTYFLDSALRLAGSRGTNLTGLVDEAGGTVKNRPIWRWNMNALSANERKLASLISFMSVVAIAVGSVTKFNIDVGSSQI
ncbi:MAG: hypothetical protein RMM53_11165 [Bacteroidia bacterium]|nr:hypothetical protein [Bacteroidia bacterium]